MALHGRRDLPLAPSPRAGFEMTVLRMLAFRPSGSDAATAGSGAPGRSATPARTPTTAASEANVSAAAPRVAPAGAAAAAARELATPTPRAAEPATPPRDVQRTVASGSAPVAPAARPPAPTAPAPTQPAISPPVADAAAAPNRAVYTGDIADADAWAALVAASNLRGPARLLAEHAGFVGYADGVLRLTLGPTDEHLRGAAMVKLVADALAPTLGAPPQIRFEAAGQPVESLRQRSDRARDERQGAAEQAFMSSPDVQRLMSQHGAKLVPDSIRPFDD
jgi:DNA polymerase-3 subunit gamma/tau